MNFFMALILVNYNNCNTQHKEMTITLNNTMIRCNKYTQYIQNYDMINNSRLL